MDIYTIFHLFFVNGSFPPENMVLIPAGNFQMGCYLNHNGGYQCHGTEIPLHTVWLDAYLLDRYEVTNAQYAHVYPAGKCVPPIS